VQKTADIRAGDFENRHGWLSTPSTSSARALPGSERPRRRSVLYCGDRQVKFLYADLDQEWSHKHSDGASPGGGLFMVARHYWLRLRRKLPPPAAFSAGDLGRGEHVHLPCCGQPA
jgi:hypothetical protein